MNLKTVYAKMLSINGIDDEHFSLLVAYTRWLFRINFKFRKFVAYQM